MSSAADRIDGPSLTRAMIEAKVVEPDAVLLGHRARPIGIGHTADTFRVELDWKQPGAGPASLVAKIPSADEQSARTAASLGAYEREALFYEVLAPRTSVDVPGYYGAMTYDGRRSGVLLEDMSASLRPGDPFTDAPVEVVDACRHQLVALQAPFWDDHQIGATPWLHRRLGVPIPGILERMERSWSTARDDLAGGFDRAERDLIDRFVARAGSWAESLDGPFSLTHHDFRFDNMLFGDGRTVVLDWQTAGWGAVMFDVAYLLGTSFGPDLRRVCEKDLIHRHVDELCEHGVTWTFDAAWQEYRRSSFAVLLMLVPPTGSVKRTDRGDDMFRRLLRSGARMALDLHAAEFLD